MTELFTNLSAGFVVLVIVSLFVIAAGFLWDSTGAEGAGGAPQQPVLQSNLSHALWDFAFAGLWAFLLFQEDRSEPEWFHIGLISIFIIFGLLHLYKHVTVDRKAH